MKQSRWYKVNCKYN